LKLAGSALDVALTRAYQEAFDAMLTQGYWVDPQRHWRWHLDLRLSAVPRRYAVLKLQVETDQFA
jgi:hypothetical protein